jgi:hypothetical protein
MLNPTIETELQTHVKQAQHWRKMPALESKNQRVAEY